MVNAIASNIKRYLDRAKSYMATGEGQMFIDLEVEHNGETKRLSDYVGKGKYVLLDMWASWCAPCKNEMPGFQQMYEKYGDQVQFLMVNVTGIDKADDAKAFIKETGYSFPVYFDTDNSMAANYYAGSVPMTYFIGSNGELVTYATGAIPADTLEQGIGMTLE